MSQSQDLRICRLKKHKIKFSSQAGPRSGEPIKLLTKDDGGTSVESYAKLKVCGAKRERENSESVCTRNLIGSLRTPVRFPILPTRA